MSPKTKATQPAGTSRRGGAAPTDPRVHVRPLRAVDLGRCAELLAGLHARAQSTGPRGMLRGLAYLSAGGCRGLLDGLLASPRATGVVAEVDGRVQAFLVGERQLFAPEDFASIYAEPRSVAVPLHGHAVEEGEDGVLLYRLMYAQLASAWVDAGFFVHNVSVHAGDAAALEAWAMLGFGRKSACAARPTAAHGKQAAAVAGVGIEEIRGRDDEVLEQSHRRLMRFQAGAPIFWPYSGESDARVRDVRREALEGGRGFALVAREATTGAALGSLLFVPAIFLPPMLAAESVVYLWEGFVEDDQRAAGVGSMLLERAMELVHAQGIAWCALHYVTANPRGGRFWPSRGFVAVEYTLCRRVDERALWHRGPLA